MTESRVACRYRVEAPCLETCHGSKRDDAAIREACALACRKHVSAMCGFWKRLIAGLRNS